MEGRGAEQRMRQWNDKILRLIRRGRKFPGVLIAIILAFCVSGVFISMAGVEPVRAFWVMFSGALGSLNGISQVMIKATPLILIGLGICIGLKGNLTNLGGDGQLIVGAIAAAMIGLALKDALAPGLVQLCALVGAMLAGGLWGMLVGLLRAHFNMNVIITTIMFNYITNYLLGYAVQGPLKAPGSFLPQTAALPEKIYLPPLIPGLRLHAGIVVAFVMAVLVYLFLRYTVWGYRIQVIGNAPKAAVYSGVNAKRYIVLIMFLCGALSGAAGMVEMYGVYYRGIAGIGSGVGFTAVSAALLAGSNPLMLLITSVFFGVISAGANMMQVTMGIPKSVINITQGTIILFALLIPAFQWIMHSIVSRRPRRPVPVSKEA